MSEQAAAVKIISYLSSLPEGTITTTFEAFQKVCKTACFEDWYIQSDDDKLKIENLNRLDKQLRGEAVKNGLRLKNLDDPSGNELPPCKVSYAVYHEKSKDKLNKWDYLISLASGSLTAAIDILWISDISLEKAHSWGESRVESFVIAAANKQGYKGKDLYQAIKKLEDNNPIMADSLTNSFGGGKYHHLRDFSHHATITGLLFSIISQFTGKGYGTDVDGKFVGIDFPEWQKPNLLSGLYNGTVTWMFHMISDMAGSSSSVKMNKEGTGLPGPMMSFLKEVLSVPGIRSLAGKDSKGHYNLSVICSKLFNGTLCADHDENGKIIYGSEIKFDLGTELGITNEMMKNKQYLPVCINKAIVSAFYVISRLTRELKKRQADSIENFENLNLKSIFPQKSPALRHMLTVASVTFSVIDISAAGIQSYILSKDNTAGFAVSFLQKINYAGIIQLNIAFVSELAGAVSGLYKKFQMLTETKIFGASKSSCGEEGENHYSIGDAASSLIGLTKISNPVTFVSMTIDVYCELSKAFSELKIAREERIKIEKECAQKIKIINENREELERAAEQYMSYRLEAFSEAFADMDKAASEKNSDKFIKGNAKIQKQLGRDKVFSSQQDFDSFMDSEFSLKL